MSEPMVALIDQLKGEYGARSRGRVLEMLLQDLIDPGDSASDPEVTPLKDDAEPASTSRSDEVTSLVCCDTIGSCADAACFIIWTLALFELSFSFLCNSFRFRWPPSMGPLVGDMAVRLCDGRARSLAIIGTFFSLSPKKLGAL